MLKSEFHTKRSGHLYSSKEEWKNYSFELFFTLFEVTVPRARLCTGNGQTIFDKNKMADLSDQS